MSKQSTGRQPLLPNRWLWMIGALVAVAATLLTGSAVWASETSLAIPDLNHGSYPSLGGISPAQLLTYGAIIIAGTLGISLYLLSQIRKQPAHQSMLTVANTIFETCKTYLIQQGKFLLMLFVLIAIAISYYLIGYGTEPDYKLTGEKVAEVKKDLQKKAEKDPTITPAEIDAVAASLTNPVPQAKVEELRAQKVSEKELKYSDRDLKALQSPLPDQQPVGKEDFAKQLALRLSPEQLHKYEGSILGQAVVPTINAGLTVLLVLFFSVIGMGGSYAVAWYGIRVNTFANARTAFASLKGRPWDVVNIPLRAGMSVGLFLISLELIMMVIILLWVPREIVGFCFLGFAIGESLGASCLRIAGGIFTKIADIGSDLMKIVFNVKEDDPRNPGVIADCTGDNAGDSVGPTADGFETYGVTGVALIAFITLAVSRATAGADYLDIQSKLIVWIFAMRFLMDFMSGCSYFINQAISEKQYGHLTEFNFETPLTRLIIIAACLCITTSFGMSYLLLHDVQVNGILYPELWWQLAMIIGCGTLAAVLIPEFTKAFTSSHSKHVHEIVTASREGGASLTILSGIVAGNFSAFWMGGLIAALMGAAFGVSTLALSQSGVMGGYESIFAFGLVAFGFLCMGPVNIAVDSYGPVTDNAQSVFELAQTEHIPGIKAEIERDFGFTPDFERGKHYLESNDSAGNTFKATAKPVLIGTAVVGATTMIFSIILLLKHAGLLALSLTDAPVLLGFICGGAVVYWFSGASMQAVTTGAYRAVEFIKKNMDLTKKAADIEDSKTVVRICTQYAQSGMWNIFIALMTITLAFAFFNPNFFVAYLVSIAAFGLFQAIYMANAGGAWDNAKKLVEVDFKEKGTAVHAATVVGDTVGDPFKDTTSVALNPIIKFSTLFGLLAVEIAVAVKLAAKPLDQGGQGVFDYTPYVGVALLAVALVFIWRSFYAMRIPPKVDEGPKHAANATPETTGRETAHTH